MREAMGSSMLLYLIIPVIILFVVFIAFIMNYSSAYRAVNDIVAQIEASSGDGCSIATSEEVRDRIREKYYYTESPTCTSASNGRGTVYTVSLKVDFELPILGKIGVYDVKAETKTIYDVSV